MSCKQFLCNCFKNSKRGLLCFVSIYFFFIHSAWATYEFNKTLLQLSLKKPIDSMTFSNSSSTQPVHLMAKVLRWTQNNGNDVYQPSTDLIIAPPFFNMPMGKSQIVRIGWRSPAPLTEELAYRLVVSDLTPYTAPKNTILLKLQINLPVFIEPDNEIFKAGWQVKRAAGNQLSVLMTDTGNIHIKVTKITITNENDEVIGSQPTAFTLLPHQSKQGLIKVNKSPGQKVKITASTDNGILSAVTNVQ